MKNVNPGHNNGVGECERLWDTNSKPIIYCRKSNGRDLTRDLTVLPHDFAVKFKSDFCAKNSSDCCCWGDFYEWIFVVCDGSSAS